MITGEFTGFFQCVHSSLFEQYKRSIKLEEMAVCYLTWGVIPTLRFRGAVTAGTAGAVSTCKRLLCAACRWVQQIIASPDNGFT
ncbi:hypothetical protein Vspart_03521 [Vibrio spartinae]|uniref:Uncharacterized protein n=1 Tax=Vibrio spartinae TaxID=1918945 RepID=A0ABX6R4A4_9VIBR|nr:hypothetical protein Vspart_03521 [Vibrio spartinae]